jgi:predicted MFS family arabinose efflux permease
MGLVIGAIFVQFANWHWAFWLVSIIAIPLGLICAFLVPGNPRGTGTQGKAQWKSLDLVGVSILTGVFYIQKQL